MDWDELTKMKKIVEEQERLQRQAALYSGRTVADTLRHSAIGDVGGTYAAQYAASQRIEAEERVRRMADGLTAGATHSALYAASERLEAEARLGQLASGSNVGAIAASMQIAEEARYRQDIGNLLGGGVAASLAAAEEARLRQLVDGALGVNYVTATSQANILAQSYTDQLRATVEGRFLLPGFSETERMLDVMRGSYFGSMQNRYGNQLPGAQEAMLAMQAPWLDSLRAVHSVRGFAELQAIGGALAIAPSFGDDFSESLRADLGDWRDPITNWSHAIGESADARRSLYVERGLNTDLTDFPDEAFDESLAIAGITAESPILVVEYGQLTSLFIDGEEGKALARTNAAHDCLQRLEFQLRKFIDQSLTKIAGANWPKHRLPNGVYDEWKSRKSKDKGQAVDWPLVAYADFTEYVDIICRNDNWKEVFEPVFKRKESVRESFQRMYAIRIAIAHVRPISNADALYFYVEVKRLLEALPRET
jgi:hypothetical protein